MSLWLCQCNHQEHCKGDFCDIDGLYALENVEPGTYTAVYSFVGYETR